MFYLFALGSMLAYALQQSLLVRHARTMDGLSLAFYRNISFLVTMLPILFGASMTDIATTAQNWQAILASAVTGGLSLSLMYGAYRFLSVSFSSTLSAAIATIMTTALGWILFSEHLSALGLGFIALTVLGVLVFGFHYKHLPHLDSRFLTGALMALGGGVFNALSKFAVSVLSREGDPFVSGYMWEASIGLMCAILILIRFLVTRQRVKAISLRQFLDIAVCGSPTLLGTGFFCLAISTGPIAIVSTVGTGGLVVVTLLAWAWYREKLDAKQILGMTLILGGIVGLRFV